MGDWISSVPSARDGVDPNVLRYPNHPRLQAADSQPRLCTLEPVRRGAQYDVCLPLSNPDSARRALESLAESIGQETEKLRFVALSSATHAGELYIQMVEVAARRYERTLQDISKDFKRTGKYTPEHTKRLLDARNALVRELSELHPATSFYRMSTADPSLVSNIATRRLSENVDKLSSASPARSAYIARTSVRRGLEAPKLMNEAPIVMDLKIAKFLRRANTALAVVELAAPAALALTAKTDAERNKALAEIGGKLSGQVVQIAATSLCVALGVATGGFGFLACGLTAMVGGMIIGEAVEKELKVRFTPAESP